MRMIRFSYRLATGCYFGLIVLLTSWYGVISPSEVLSIPLVLGILLLPLLFPLHGILKGRPYTFAWASFLSLFYFTHGVVEIYGAPEDRWLAMLEVLLSIGFYVGSVLYARHRGRQLKSQRG
ncbi:MAG: DUF2069 domain-containing protein [Pseudomonadota bacterium]